MVCFTCFTVISWILHECLIYVLRVHSFLPICSVLPTITTPGNNLVIMEDLQNWQRNYSCLSRKHIEVAYPICSFPSRQPGYDKGTASTYAAQAFPNIERNLSLMLHFVEKSSFLVLAGSISLMGLGFSSCRYPGRRMTASLGRMVLRSAWQNTRYFYCLNDYNSLMFDWSDSVFWLTGSVISSAFSPKDWLGSREHNATT